MNYRYVIFYCLLFVTNLGMSQSIEEKILLLLKNERINVYAITNTQKIKTPSIEHIQTNINYIGNVKSEDDRYTLVNLLMSPIHNYGLKYFIYDSVENKITSIKRGLNFDRRQIDKFAKFIGNRLVIGETDGFFKFHLKEYNLLGELLVEKKGKFPNNQKCKCHDIEENMIIWLETINETYIISRIDLATKEKILLAEISGYEVESMNYTRKLPTISINSESNEIIISKSKYEWRKKDEPIVIQNIRNERIIVNPAILVDPKFEHRRELDKIIFSY
jgi:hypothetical protein